jgi:uncharacterized membrane protein YccF (DUF307 family)
MKIVANIIWIIFGGLITALLWTALGLLLCISVIGIPLGVQCFKVARLSFAPFGKNIDLNPKKHLIANIIWGVLIGWGLAAVYLVSAIAACITVVGIPNALLSLKLMKLSFMPFGARIVKK